MSWFARFSRFGNLHMVRSQDKDMALAMCSIVMVNFKMKKGLMFAGMAVGEASPLRRSRGPATSAPTLAERSISLAIKSEKEVIKLYEGVKVPPTTSTPPAPTRTCTPRSRPSLAWAIGNTWTSARPASPKP